MQNTYTTHSEEETRNLGIKLGKRLKKGDCVAFYGELGAGKTVFIKGIVKGLECLEPVRSPSFIIVAEYKCKIPIFHIDLYRIESNVSSLDLKEYFYGDGICLVEWAERIKDHIPDNRIDIHIKIIDEDTRKITIDHRV